MTLESPHLQPISDLTSEAGAYSLTVDGLTQGSLAIWMTCPVKARLKLLHGLRVEGNRDALEFGNIIHKNLELTYSWWGGLLYAYPYNDPQLTPSQTAAKLFREEEARVVNEIVASIGEVGLIQKMEVAYGQADALLAHYYQIYESDFFDLNWLALEQEFEIPYNHFGNGYEHSEVTFPVRGKIDGIFEDTNGDLWIVDHKTKGKIDDPTIVQKLGVDLQTNLYVWAVRRLYGRDVKGVVYNLIKRPQLRQGVRESNKEFIERTAADIAARPREYFSRISTVYSQEDTLRFEVELSQIISAFVDWYYGYGPHYRNSGSCVQGFWPCEFLRYCGDGETFGFTKSELVYPELEYRQIPE